MIGSRTPFRVSFVGGGSDLPGFYTRHPGCVVSTTINKYMYIFLHPYFENKIQVKYSQTELANSIDEIRHPIVREALRKFGLTRIDINSIADIPAGTGLGSSSSFTVGLLHALYAYVSKYPVKETLAREASSLEIDILKEPIGKQDQYAAAYGGLNFITFCPNHEVNVEPIIMPPGKWHELEANLAIFYLGETRAARDILTSQKSNIENDKGSFNNLVTMSKLAGQLRNSLENGLIADMGYMLDEAWQLKKQLSRHISHERIDYFYQKALDNGALGGKLLGAGGGGFLLFYVDQNSREKVSRALHELTELKFKFDSFGTKIILIDQSERNSA